MARHGYCRRIRNIPSWRHIRLLVRICTCHPPWFRPPTRCSTPKDPTRHPHPLLLWQSRPMDLRLSPRLLRTDSTQNRLFHRHRGQVLLPCPWPRIGRKASHHTHPKSHIRKPHGTMAIPPPDDTPPWLCLWLSLECTQSQKARFHREYQSPPQLL